MLRRQFLPLPEYKPDQPALHNDGATVANGCYPRTDKSYGPVAAPAAFTGALAARCQGFFAARSAAGNVSVFAGDATKLSKLQADNTWADVSGSAYATNADEHWRFVQDGQSVLATNFANHIQTWATLDSSVAFANLNATDAPKARFIAKIDPGFLMVGNIEKSGAYPNRVWWPNKTNHADWPTPGSAAAAAALSGYADLDKGGWVQGIVPAVGGARGAIMMDKAIYRIDGIVLPEVFQFSCVVEGIGLLAPNCLASLPLPTGQIAVAFLSQDGFYLFDGQAVTPIGGSRVDKTFFSEVNQSALHRVYMTADPINKLLIVAYPTAGTTPNRWLFWNWAINRWSYADDPAIACEIIGTSLTQGYTLDSLDAISSSIDDLPYSLDSRIWTGGALALATFDADHKLALLSGDTLAATVETLEVDGTTFGATGRRLFVGGARVLCDGGTRSSSVGWRNDPGAAVTYDGATTEGADGVCPQRRSARFMRVRASIAAGGSWQHLHGVEIVGRPEGMR